MIEKIKKILYFPVASHFRFFAAIRLRRWHPKIVVVTGSSGKTTLLHLLESQIGEQAKYSHHANSSYGIPFDILNLHRKSLQLSEWVELFLKAPLAVFGHIPKEKIYVIEADCDRPGEGIFLASLLKPAIVLWVNVSRTHSMNFDASVSQKKFSSVDEAIAYEYGYFLQYCSELAIVNGDLPFEVQQTKRTLATVTEVSRQKYLDKYTIDQKQTLYVIQNNTYAFKALLPEEMFYSIAMAKEAVLHLDLPFDASFTRFVLPFGRSTLLHGIKGTTIIDSSYNANLASTKALLAMYEKFPAKKKWVVLADMLELGESEQEEHEKLAELLIKMDLERIILFGPRTSNYTESRLKNLGFPVNKIVSFQALNELAQYIHKHISGNESILFKGSQSMLLEGVIEGLLFDKKDAQLLPRREAFWAERRRQKGL